MQAQPNRKLLASMTEKERQNSLSALFSQQKPKIPTPEVKPTKDSGKSVFKEFQNTHFLAVPYSILEDHSMTPTERILLSMINSLDRTEDHCYATNEYFSKTIGVSERQVRKIITTLEELEKIKIKGRKKNRRIIKSLSHDKKLNS